MEPLTEANSEPTLVLNSQQSPCVSLLGAGITGLCHHAQLILAGPSVSESPIVSLTFLDTLLLSAALSGLGGMFGSVLWPSCLS